MEHHDTSTISVSKVTFSLHDIEDSSSFLPSELPSIQHSFLSGSLVVPCLFFAIMVVCAILLQALFSDEDGALLGKQLEDDEEDAIRRKQFDLPIRIPVHRRRVYVLETIDEQPHHVEDPESTR